MFHSNKMFFAAALALFAAIPAANAVTLSNPAARATSVSGNGLTGRYYGEVTIEQSIYSTDCAMDYISENKPVAAFTSSAINYTGGKSDSVCDTSETLGDFLGKDAASLSNPKVAGNALTGQLFDFTGYLNVAKKGTYTFTLGSDDGSRLLIGGQTIVDNAKPQSFNSRSNQVQFMEPGLYPLEVAYFENWGDTGVRLSSNMGDYVAPVSSSVLFSGPNALRASAVPEPGSVALLVGMGTMVCGLVRRKRRK